jgi:hypothetical protein
MTNLEKTIATSRAAFVSMCTTGMNRRNVVRPSHMGLPRESKGASKHSGDKESIEVTKAKTTRKEEDHRKEK